MTIRYLHGVQGQVSWGVEGTAYTKATTVTNVFGLVGGSIQWPVANPLSAEPTAGHRRAPYLHAREQYDHSFSVGYKVQGGALLPWACALGASDAISGTGYTGFKYSEADRLPTITVEHDQKDANLQEFFVGCKSDLRLSAKQGEALQATQDFVAASRSITSGTPLYPEISIPTTDPYMFWQTGEVRFAEEESAASKIAIVSGFDLAWKNGLEAKNAGGGRDAYYVVENEVAGRYDMKLTITPTDKTFWDWAHSNEPLEVTIPLIRTGASVAAATDSVVITLYGCKIIDAPIPLTEKGEVQSEIVVAPTSTEINQRIPTA
jgi:hypothetical protein